MASKDEKKIKEADENFKKAKKLSKKSFFQWKPDYENAAPLFEKAANAYRIAKMWEICQEAFFEASECHRHADNLFPAAKNMESAASAAKEQMKVNETCELYEKAATLYRLDGKPDKAAEALTKGGKIMEEIDVEKSTELLVSALDILESEDKEHLSTPTYTLLISMLVKNSKYSDAVKVVQRQLSFFEKMKQPHQIFKSTLASVVLYLCDDKFVEAENLYNETVREEAGFAGTEESFVSAELLDAYDSRDQDKLSEVTAKTVFLALDYGIGRLARNMKVGFGGGRSKPAAKKPAASSSEPELEKEVSDLSISKEDEADKPKHLPDIDDEYKVDRSEEKAPAEEEIEGELRDDDIL